MTTEFKKFWDNLKVQRNLMLKGAAPVLPVQLLESETEEEVLEIVKKEKEEIFSKLQRLVTANLFEVNALKDYETSYTFWRDLNREFRKTSKIRLNCLRGAKKISNIATTINADRNSSQA